jgi:hypothetical protein
LAGSLQFLWNRLLDAEKAEHAISKKFIRKADLQRLTVKMKTTTPSGLPICQPMRFSIVPLASAVPFEPASNTARLVESGAFPSQKKKFVREAGIYCVGQATAFADRVVKVPKMGEMRGGELPDAPACSSQVARRRPSG